MTYHEIDNGIGSSLHSVILWQYENAETIKAFVESMCQAAYMSVDDFWDKWAIFRANVENAANAQDGTFNLSVIGATCGIPRPDDISNATYARLIICRMKLSMTTAASTADYKAYMDELFGEHVTVGGVDTFVRHATLTDNLDMSVSTTYETDDRYSEFGKLYHSEDWTPYGHYWLVLPTGVKRGISSWGGTIFGFYRTNADSPVPAIGPFDNRFATPYQYQYIRGERT
jgi:hypothetical protein